MTAFRFLTAGESHGPALTAVIEGVPAGLGLTEEKIVADLVRRQGGYGRGRRQQIETDRARITSGVRHAKTIGSPIALWIENADHQNANWQTRMGIASVDEEVEAVTLLRPGHADLTGTQKYGFDDVRPILERSSARETAARVAVGAIARALLAEIGIEVHSHTVSIGEVVADVPEQIDWDAVDASPVRIADADAEVAQPEADVAVLVDHPKHSCVNHIRRLGAHRGKDLAVAESRTHTANFVEVGESLIVNRNQYGAVRVDHTKLPRLYDLRYLLRHHRTRTGRPCHHQQQRADRQLQSPVVLF